MSECVLCGCVDSMKYMLANPRCVHEKSCKQRVELRAAVVAAMQYLEMGELAQAHATLRSVASQEIDARR